jgi:ParB family chromosome partitioning protein
MEPEPTLTASTNSLETPARPVIEAQTHKAEVALPPRPTPGNPHNFEVRRVAIDQIVVEENRQTLNQDKINRLAESIAEIGLRTPVTVREINGKPTLVTGQHRLEAAKKLGWSDIDAFIFKGDETDARLWELAENLFRKDLTVLERAVSINEWFKLVTEKRKAGQAAHPGGEQPHDKGISGAARDLKITREEVRRAAKIAGISSEAKLRVSEAGLADNQSALMRIAEEPAPEAQVKRVEEIAARRSAPRRKSSKPSQPGMAAGTSLQIQDAVPEPALRQDETLTAEQEAQLATLRTSWRVHNVLRREEFESASAVTQGHFIRDELFATTTVDATVTRSQRLAAVS